MIRLGNIIKRFSRYVDVWIYQGSYVDGRWVNGAPTKVQLYGSLQETTGGAILNMLPEGVRLNETRVFYSKQSLPVDDLQYEAGKNDIRFVVDGITYRMINNQKWDGDYSLYLLQLLRSDNAIPTS